MLIVGVLLAGAVRSVVLHGSVAIKPDQPPASVAIIMVDGRAENTGCAGGIVYSGRFVVSVRAPGVKQETDLNDLLHAETLSFPEDFYWHTWPIVFADFNHDGQPDFSIAPHFCGNNGKYSLLTIGPDGRVSTLRIVPEGPLWIADGAPSSSAIEVTADGFRVSAYDNTGGSGFFRSYRWHERQHAFVLVTPTPVPGK